MFGWKAKAEEKERTIVLLSTQVSDLLALIKSLQEQHGREKEELMRNFLAAASPASLRLLQTQPNAPRPEPVRGPQKPSRFAEARIARPPVPVGYTNRPVRTEPAAILPDPPDKGKSN